MPLPSLPELPLYFSYHVPFVTLRGDLGTPRLNYVSAILAKKIVIVVFRTFAEAAACVRGLNLVGNNKYDAIAEPVEGGLSAVLLCRRKIPFSFRRRAEIEIIDARADFGASTAKALAGMSAHEKLDTIAALHDDLLAASRS